MKTTTTILLVLLSGLLLSCSINVNTGKSVYNGVMIESIEFENEQINSIRVGHAFKVRIIKTNSESDNRIALNVSERVSPYVKTSLRGGRLSVTLENTPRNFSTKSGEMFVEIYTEEFSTIHGSGSTDFTVLDGFDYKTLDLTFSGASDIKFESVVNVEDDVKINGSGASDIEIGQLNADGNLSIRLSGASDVKINDVSVVGIANVELSGASDIDVNAMNVGGGFNYSMSGASDMNITTGECQATANKLRCSGSSDYHASGFVVNSMSLNLSGASSAKVNVLGEIRVSVGGASNLDYKSNPETKIFNTNQKSNIRSF